MKLLFDQNLSPLLVNALRDLFPDSRHVMTLNLDHMDDEIIWEYAKMHSFCITSKDSDFVPRSLLRGFPPKVIYLALGNCPTSVVEAVLRDNFEVIDELARNSEKSCLVLPP